MALARVVATSSLSKRLVSDGISFLGVAHRRGYAAAGEAARRTVKPEDKATVAQLLAGKRVAAATDPDPWVPDPVTGYYQPANGPVQVDAAELRAMLLRPKA